MKIKKYPKYAAFSDLMIYEYAAKITLQWLMGKGHPNFQS